jgi:hypothetical protein
MPMEEMDDKTAVQLSCGGASTALITAAGELTARWHCRFVAPFIHFIL